MKVTVEINKYEFAQIVTDMNEAVEGVKDVTDDIKDVVDELLVKKLKKLGDEYPYLQKVLGNIQTAIDED